MKAMAKGELKVDPKELHDVKDIMNKDSESYDEIIEKMLKSVDKLSLTWEGQDAEEFCEKLKNYLEKMKNLPKNMRLLSEGVKKVNTSYVEKDEEFGKELEKGVLKNEPEPKNS